MSLSVAVDYATADGTATERKDYAAALGTLRFDAGETSKTFDVLITDDAFQEQDETINLALSNPTGGALLGARQAATVVIAADDNPPPATNPIDESSNFVRQHYHDFLGRAPDASGLAFWTNEIEQCGSNAQCREVRRINVSAAFFLSIEFQETGYLSYRAHKAAFGNLQGKPVPITWGEMLRDMQTLGNGVVVGADGWQQRLEQNKRAYFNLVVASQRFVTLYPQAMTPAQFVDALNANAGGALSQPERDALVGGLQSGALTRAAVLRALAEDSDLSRAETNKAFVLMEYFGYLRRNPDDAPDSNFVGWQFWLGKLDEFGGDFIRAEMVKAFLSADEYRHRFGQ
jgi:hypothetical protein